MQFYMLTTRLEHEEDYCMLLGPPNENLVELEARFRVQFMMNERLFNEFIEWLVSDHDFVVVKSTHHVFGIV